MLKRKVLEDAVTAINSRKRNEIIFLIG